MFKECGGDPGYAVMCALATSFVTFLPSFFFIFGGAPYVERLRSNGAIKSALAGVSAAVVGVVLNLAIVFGSAVFVGGNGVVWFSILLGLAAFDALQIFKVDVLLVVLAGGFLGLAKHLIVGLIQFVCKKRRSRKTVRAGPAPVTSGFTKAM